MKLPYTLSRTFSYTEYLELVDQLVKEGKTTGPNQSESLIEYTVLNQRRLLRLNKTIKLQPDLVGLLQNNTTPQTWYVLTEAWCGDAAQVLPALNKMAETTNSIDLKLVLRDENPEFMDAHLTNGGKSIPKLVSISSEGEELFTWGPRPAHAQSMLHEFKTNPNGKSDKDFKTELHLWYSKDKTNAIQTEFRAFF